MRLRFQGYRCHHCMEGHLKIHVVQFYLGYFYVHYIVGWINKNYKKKIFWFLALNFKLIKRHRVTGQKEKISTFKCYF